MRIGLPEEVEDRMLDQGYQIYSIKPDMNVVGKEEYCRTEYFINLNKIESLFAIIRDFDLHTVEVWTREGTTWTRDGVNTLYFANHDCGDDW